MKPYGNFRKLYESLRPYDQNRVAVLDLRDLAEIHSIWQFYEKLSEDELHLLSAAIKKAEAQLAYIPFCFTTVPLVFVIFSSKLSAFFIHNLIILVLCIAVLSLLGIFLIHRHFTHKSYNALHLHIVETILDLKKNSAKPKKEEDEVSSQTACHPDSF